MRKRRTETYTGMIPYYRRTLKRIDAVAVYFRYTGGKKAGRIVISDKDKAALFVSGKSYTIEQTYL